MVFVSFLVLSFSAFGAYFRGKKYVFSGEKRRDSELKKGVKKSGFLR